MCNFHNNGNFGNHHNSAVFYTDRSAMSEQVAPGLPATSANSINGTWDPALINTSNIGTEVYTFTPDPNQCAEIVTMTIEVTDLITPDFAAIGPLLQNSTAPALPAVSTNGIPGSWTPTTVSTATVGTTTYTFTPADRSVCDYHNNGDYCCKSSSYNH